MRVALIRCGARSRETNVTGCYPPLGLAYVAASLRDADHDVCVIDGEASGFGIAEVVAAIPGDVRMIGISSTTLAWPVVRESAVAIRAAFPDALLVIGGPHVTAFPEETIAASSFDIGVLGDGELTAVELAERVERGQSYADLPGCVVREEHGERVNLPIPWTEELDALPAPALDLLPANKYHSVLVEEPFTTMVTSRGCPFRCHFCSQIYSGDTLRSRSAGSIVDEMARAVAGGVKEVVFFDETFGARREVAMQVCELIRQRGLKVRWNARTRVNVVTRELLVAMKEAGCYAIHLGVESGTERVLKLMNKCITLDQVRQAVALAREVGFQTHAYFMIGYPGETRQEVEQTIRFSRQLKLDWASYTITVPNPRTPLCDLAEAEGWLPPGYWQAYTRGEVDDGPHYFHSDECPARYLESAKRRAYLRFYMRPGVLFRNLLFFVRRGGLRRAFAAMRLWLREERM